MFVLYAKKSQSPRYLLYKPRYSVKYMHTYIYIYIYIYHIQVGHAHWVMAAWSTDFGFCFVRQVRAISHEYICIMYIHICILRELWLPRHTTGACNIHEYIYIICIECTSHAACSYCTEKCYLWLIACLDLSRQVFCADIMWKHSAST